jgi:hypothetical protein
MYLSIGRERTSVEPHLIGDRVGKLYMLRGQPSRYDSTSNEGK